jgi:hypothetical protein
VPGGTLVKVARAYRVVPETLAVAAVLSAETLVEVARAYRVVPETLAAAAVLSAEMLVEVAWACRVVPETLAAAAVLSAEVPVGVGVWRVAAALVAGEALLTVAQVPPITRAVRVTSRRRCREDERNSTTRMGRRSRRTRAAKCTGLKFPAAWPAETRWWSIADPVAQG